MKKMQITILIADGNELVRKFLVNLFLESDDINLIGQACNGEEVISFAISLIPDVIMMEISMSPVNGFEATRKILKHNPFAKIIALSIHTELPYVNNMMKLGARGYVAKSAPPHEIVEAVFKVNEGGKYIGTCLDGQT